MSSRCSHSLQPANHKAHTGPAWNLGLQFITLYTPILLCNIVDIFTVAYVAASCQYSCQHGCYRFFLDVQLSEGGRALRHNTKHLYSSTPRRVWSFVTMDIQWRVSLSLDRPDAVYYAGQDIGGIARVELEEAIDIIGVELRLLGCEWAQWSERAGIGPSYQPVVQSSQIMRLDHTSVLWGTDLRAVRARDCFHLPRGNQRILRGQKANVQLANTGGQKFAENKEPESKRIHHCQIANTWKAPIYCIYY
ncbi:hypothetical protein CAPTEDRAFT_205624 [Capitella teleta]|uniref:Uncharacterized protein n=1 Tax=Capitella teleta TaxID=283909 RepID=R7VIZ7_CAPTE|nr:hypothetical protein CAPTEDRAFT_205624 [Capitella teleta]|eukprot:ELU16271.1 hypothetical protein CAPTEDRAFT_205624 [Capitella teleta]